MKADGVRKSDFLGGAWKGRSEAPVSSSCWCPTTAPRDAAGRCQRDFRGTLCQPAPAYVSSSIHNWRGALIHLWFCPRNVQGKKQLLRRLAEGWVYKHSMLTKPLQLAGGEKNDKNEKNFALLCARLEPATENYNLTLNYSKEAKK